MKTTHEKLAQYRAKLKKRFRRWLALRTDRNASAGARAAAGRNCETLASMVNMSAEVFRVSDPDYELLSTCDEITPSQPDEIFIENEQFEAREGRKWIL